MTDFGFTGTSEGTTPPQRGSFREFVRTSGMTKFRHGDCVHADCDAHIIVRQELPSVPIHGHLPVKDEKRANCDFDTTSEPKGYFARNRDIAEECGELLAMPKGPETPYGGTWYTINRARRLRKPVTIFWPDGTVTREQPAPEGHAE